MSIHSKMKRTFATPPLLIVFYFFKLHKAAPFLKGRQHPLTPKITGTVTLYNDLLSKVSPDGMTVSIEGTSYTATTDSGGKYIFKDVKI